MRKNTFKPLRQDDPPKLIIWIPCLPIALVQGKTKNYLVDYEARTCGCPNHQLGHNRNCRHIAHVVSLVPLCAATEPLQYVKGLYL